ncbi:MAG: hypothetical protein ACM37U_01220, partial [Gemmatimonas sp.]
ETRKICVVARLRTMCCLAPLDARLAHVRGSERPIHGNLLGGDGDRLELPSAVHRSAIASGPMYMI